MTSTPTPEQAATIAAALKAAGRTSKAAPLRRSFVQQGSQKNPKPGPLQAMVERHDETGLDLYLLLVAGASSEPWDVARDARVWGRAIGHGFDVDGGRSIVSKAWLRLDETYHLVERQRSGRLARITLLDESGNGEPYTSPEKAYLKLPFAYWSAEEAWYAQLTLRAKATLLIALSLRQPFVLPAERAESWYGISADSIDRGQRELRKHGILTRNFTVVPDWLSGTGSRTDYTFSLKSPFAPMKKLTGKKPVTKGHLSAVAQP
ncbi:hypothetical protein [Nocardioides hwasunensis]|uniref:Transcriptional regulator n=1 Tax=Nocardioides hwasunensis TaxID=397258 RepID=A0ABR8MG82_9ACTN|nr:hypothetical protein [Nocardioides hwasunensis]MBD3915084.1 hypothetical protein [Nocardioides hwasunensis]